MLEPPELPTGSTLIELRTNTLRCFFEQETGFLRRISVGEVEVIRAIYGAVRDHAWNTVPAVVSGIQLTQEENKFELRFEVECRRGSAQFHWTGCIRAEGGGLEFFFHGRAIRTFERNRIGLCVLHPLVGCAGRPCRILATDGNWSDGEFPAQIAPHQPFKDVRGMAWKPADGIAAELALEGDVFETEDQRNWTDASFKTYSTPLALPFPVAVASGTTVSQRVRLNVSAEAVISSQGRGEVVEIRLRPNAVVRKPPIGLCLASHSGVLTMREAGLLRRLAISHLRVDLRLSDSRWLEAWARAQGEAANLGAALHCALFPSANAAEEMDAFAVVARSAKVPVALALVFDAQQPVTPPETLSLAEKCLSAVGIEVGGGANQYFAELNRARPAPGTLACFSLNPQVHAFDDLSLVENLEGEREAVASALAFGARAVAISPITLRPRFNQHAPGDTGDGSELPTSVDPRQRTLLGAVWTLGCLAQLALVRGVHSLTFYETTGWRGLMEQETGSPLPAKFPSAPGEVFPLYHVFASLADVDSIIPVETSASQSVAGLALLQKAGGFRLMLGNMQPVSQRVLLPDGYDVVSIQPLDGESVASANAQPEAFRRRHEILLEPYSIVTVELR